MNLTQLKDDVMAEINKLEEELGQDLSGFTLKIKSHFEAHEQAANAAADPKAPAA